MHIVQEGRRDTLAWTFLAVQGVGDMLFERLPEPVDALRSCNNRLRNLPESRTEINPTLTRRRTTPEPRASAIVGKTEVSTSRKIKKETTGKYRLSEMGV